MQSQYHKNLNIRFQDRLRTKYFRFKGASILEHSYLLSGSQLIRFIDNISLGSSTIIKKHAQICACNSKAIIEIGSDTTIGDYSYIYSSDSIKIGSRVLIAPFCYLVDGNHSIERDTPIRHQPLTTDPIVIDSEVWLGTRVVVLPGVTVGEGAVIAAGSVVTKSVPSFEIWGGSPAKKIGER